MVKLPVVTPLAIGANFKVTAALCEGARVTGVALPLTKIPVPLAVIWVSVTLEFPVFETCTVCVALLPTFTFPKLTLAGKSDMVYVAATPVPFKATAGGAICASLVIAIAPVAAPAAVGANLACNATDCPVETVTGKTNPPAVNAPPVTPTCVICTFDWPEL